MRRCCTPIYTETLKFGVLSRTLLVSVLWIIGVSTNKNWTLSLPFLITNMIDPQSVKYWNAMSWETRHHLQKPSFKRPTTFLPALLIQLTGRILVYATSSAHHEASKIIPNISNLISLMHLQDLAWYHAIYEYLPINASSLKTRGTSNFKPAIMGIRMNNIRLICQWATSFH